MSGHEDLYPSLAQSHKNLDKLTDSKRMQVVLRLIQHQNCAFMDKPIPDQIGDNTNVVSLTLNCIINP